MADIESLERKIDHLTELVNTQVNSICQDVRGLQTMMEQQDRQIMKLFTLSDWIPRLQGAVALLVVLIPIMLWFAAQKR